MSPSAQLSPTATAALISKSKAQLTSFDTGAHVRLASRNGNHATTTSGLAPTYLQANLIVLPSRYANDFRILCARNPVPCPLLAESESAGSWNTVKSWVDGLEGSGVVSGVDIRRDAPKYMVYKDSKLVKFQCEDIVQEWTEDHVAFFIGCSFSFESALSAAGLVPRHIIMDRVVPMYRTNIPLCPAGVFSGSTCIVSMRPYRGSEIEAVRTITRPYIATHGEPIAWGWDAAKKLGIQNINSPDWGEPPLASDGKPLGDVEGDEENIPVFWGCGVTPQEAVMRAGLEGTIMGHAPGHMLVLDCRDWDVVKQV